MTLALDALRAVDFNWTRALRDVWTDPPYHVEELNKATVEMILEEFQATTRDPEANPIGQVIQGRAGAGKTHLIGALRRRVWLMHGWFVLVDIIGLNDFWKTVAHSFVDSLHQRLPNNQPQYKAVIGGVLRLMFRDERARRSIGEPLRAPLTERQAADLYLRMLAEFDPGHAHRHRDVVRALIFLDAEESEESDFARMWLRGENIEDERRRAMGFLASAPDPAENVRGLSWLMSLVGPTMIAIDQIDAIVGASNTLREAGDRDPSAETELRRAHGLIDLMALGLIDLHDVKRRAMTVVSCLEPTWEILAERAIEPFAGRFWVLPTLRPVSEVATVEGLITERLAVANAAVGFEPPYPSWPFRREAIESAVGLRPRQILIRCQTHRRACLEAGEARECFTLAAPTTTTPRPAPISSLGRFDALYSAEKAKADPSVIGADEAANAERLVHVCELLLGHLDLPDSVDGEVKPDSNRRAPSLHASLSFVFHDEGDKQQRWCFRFLPQDHAVAFQSRLRAAIAASGLDTALKFRRLIILRDAPPPRGAKTQELVDEFARAGGEFVALTEADRRAFLALIAISERQLPEFEAWLRSRRPLFDTALFTVAGLAPPAFLATAPQPSPAGAAPLAGATPVARAAPVSWAAPGAAPAPMAERTAPASSVDAGRREIVVGQRLDRGVAGAAVTLAADLLPRHVVIIGGPGSGKTVFLSRLLEDAALIGIPSLALDINNDLSRLGEAWPSRPEAFDDSDAAQAEAYHARVDVVIWTPGVSAGNPLSLRLLPDFAAIGASRDADTEEEREQAVQMALATLGVGILGTGQKARLKEGVLADALRLFARGGGRTIEDFLVLLGDFDDEASKISDARKLARELADQLNALIAANPMAKMSGPDLDPATLFQSASGKPRISVINLSGLASDALKQAFVNRLNMTLFSWIKQHPSPTGRLYALDEAQNYAPSQARTACSRSTNALVAQARKYGLGMIFATQHPKGIDNAIVSNATTHAYGRVSAPATIQSIQEMAAAKGGGADDIARLGKGEFYFATEGFARPVKIRGGLCLSWRPANPPTADEVVALARARATS